MAKLWRLGLWVCSISVVITIATWLAWQRIIQPLPQNDVVITIAKGQSDTTTNRQLAHLYGLPEFLVEVLHMWHMNHMNKSFVKYGKHPIPQGSTIFTAWDILAQPSPVFLTFTIIPGWNLSELSEAIVAIHEAKTPEEAREKMQTITKQFPEGQFLAETYSYVEGKFWTEVMERAHRFIQKELTELQPTVSYSGTEILAIASIIQKETNLPEEQALVSAVIYNRLQAKMPLQMDPTVIYAASDYKGNLQKKHLQEDHPYNTYIHKGLPPTPIAMVQKSSLFAAAKPAEVDYLFFVAHPNKPGHAFSTTLLEHTKAVKALIKQQ